LKGNVERGYIIFTLPGACLKVPFINLSRNLSSMGLDAVIDGINET
jgi:hypothetical protein